MSDEQHTLEDLSTAGLQEIRAALLKEYDVATGDGDAERARRIRSLLTEVSAALDDG